MEIFSADFQLFTVIRTIAQIGGQSLSPLPPQTWTFLCWTTEVLLLYLGFPCNPNAEKVKHDEEIYCCESSRSDSSFWGLDKLSTVMTGLLVASLCFLVGYIVFHYRYARNLWSTDRRLFYMAVTSYLSVPGFAYSMRRYFPYIESTAAWIGLDITHKYYYIVARAAYPACIGLAAWAAWWLTPHMEKRGEERLDREDGAVKKGVSDV